MPAPEKTDRFQDAVLWTRDGNDSYGQPRVGDPIPLKVRWITKRRLATDSNGNAVVLDATAVVAQRIDVGSLMALGKLDDWGEVGTGSSNSALTLNTGELMEVLTYDETPDLKAREVQRSVGLKRFRDNIAEPAVE